MIPIGVIAGLTDYNKLLNAANKLVDVDEQIEKCSDCVVGHWCLEHSNQYQEAFMELKRVVKSND